LPIFNDSISFKGPIKKEEEDEWSISPTFYERICADILAPKRVQTWRTLANQEVIIRIGPLAKLIEAM
jgi:hypothetical protein